MPDMGKGINAPAAAEMSRDEPSAPLLRKSSRKKSPRRTAQGSRPFGANQTKGGEASRRLKSKTACIDDAHRGTKLGGATRLEWQRHSRNLFLVLV